MGDKTGDVRSECGHSRGFYTVYGISHYIRGVPEFLAGPKLLAGTVTTA
jgi:hypothetical protein